MGQRVLFAAMLIGAVKPGSPQEEVEPGHVHTGGLQPSILPIPHLRP